jgi:hypothetical protein
LRDEFQLPFVVSSWFAVTALTVVRRTMVHSLASIEL